MGIFDRALDRARALLALPTPSRDAVDPNTLDTTGGSRLYQSTSAMYNAVTGHGTSRDPSFWNRWAVARPLTGAELYGMGRNGLIVQALGKLPNTATREGWRAEITDPSVDSPGEVADAVAAYEAKLGTGRACARAIARGRQYGDGIVLLGIDDGRAWSEPVDRENIQSLKWVAVVDRRDFDYYKLYPSESDHFGKVEQFEITDINGVLEDGLRRGYGSISYTGEQLDLIDDQTRSAGRLLVHADRVLHFPTADYLSLLETLQDSLGAFFEAMSGIRTGARESSTVVYKVSSWLRKMWSENVGLATRHMAFVDQAKNSSNAWVIDKENEEVSMVSRNVSGLSKLADPFMVWLAAALAMPVTVLWGVSPGGFGKGDAERETWHEEVRAFQDNVLAPQIFKVQGYILAAFDGPQLSYDTQRKVKFNDLTPPDEEKTSKLRNEALMELRQQAKEGFITRAEFRTAAAQLADDFYRLELDAEFVDRPAPAQVGIFTGSTALLQALFPPETGGIPPAAGRALLLALDPVHFNPENVSQIIPIDETPPAPTLPAPSAPDETDDGSGEDEDFDSEEIDELEQQWSTAAPPADVMPSKKLAKHPDLAGRVKGLEITLAAKKQVINTYPDLLGRPVYSLAEVKRALLSGNGFAPQADALVRDAHEPARYKTAFMLRLPEHLARWVPYKPDELSAPHVTIAYLGKIDPSQFADVFEVGREVISATPPINVGLEDVDYFDNDERVAFVRVQSPALLDLYARLVEALTARGVDVKTHESGYTPHVTLAYMEPGTEYDGPYPGGDWTAPTVELWYDDAVIPIACAPAVVQDEAEPVRDPFATEHAARQREPEDFDEQTFRRINITTGVDAIVGKLRSRPDGGMVVQTYRFDAEKFTPAQARAWLVENGTKRESVEAARDSEYGAYTEAAGPIVMTDESYARLTADGSEEKREHIAEAARQAGQRAASRALLRGEPPDRVFHIRAAREQQVRERLASGATPRIAPPVIDISNSACTVTLDVRVDDIAATAKAAAFAVAYELTVLAAEDAAEAFVASARARDLSEEKRRKRIDEAFAKFHETVNMSASELESWAKTEWSKKASLSREPIERNLRLLRKKKEDWTLSDATGAMKTVNFVARMRGNERGEPVKIDGREGPSKRDISLKNWAFNPSK